MSILIEFQKTLNHAPERVLHALTDSAAVATWFAESAEIDFTTNQYNFWGRFTPAAGTCPITLLEANALTYQWQIGSLPTTVEMRWRAVDGKTVLGVRHTCHADPTGSDWAGEDFWFLSLDNLGRFLDGKSVTRCDFSADMRGDVAHIIEIDADRDTVFDLLINPTQLEKWIAANANIEPVSGGRYDIGWKAGGPIKILDLIPNEKLAYSWEAWQSMPQTVSTWTLAEVDGKTHLTLVQSGFAADFDNTGLFVGWLHFMIRIQSLAESGAYWRPTLMRLTPEQAMYYAREIAAAQEQMLQLF